MTWLRPWMIWAALAALLAGGLGVQTVRLAEAAADHERTMREFAEATMQAIQEALVREAGLRGDLEQLQARTAKEMEDAKSREDALVESVRAGHRRLSIPARCPSGSGIRAPAAGGSGTQVPRAELDGPAGEFLIGLTRDGDTAIRERNACIEAYEAVRRRLNDDAAPGPAGN